MLDMLLEIMQKFASTLAKVLPTSPFQRYISAFSNLPYLGYVNWFIPIGPCLKIGAAWLSVIVLFYLYSIVMRWLKVIGG